MLKKWLFVLEIRKKQDCGTGNQDFECQIRCFLEIVVLNVGFCCG